MNCKEIIDNLEAYIQNDLDESIKSELEKHLSECSECNKEYIELRNSIKSIKKAYSEVEIPAKLSSISLATVNFKTRKRIITIKKASLAIACVFVLLLGIFFIPNSTFTEKVIAGDYRGGFTLTPVSSDSTGIKPDSEFILDSKNSIDLKKLEASLSIDKEPAPHISENGLNSFKIKPARELKQNSLYTFRIKSPDRGDITWTFQTCATFKILGAFPGDKTTDVPTNSGIEIYFSHEGFEDIDKYFEISPKAEGRFERHKKAVVFVPKALKEATLYTVKVKKGLKLTGTDYTIGEDFSFQFETTSTSENSPYEKGFFSYLQSINEFVPDEAPNLLVNYHINTQNQNNTIKVKTGVYAYKDADSFIAVLENIRTTAASSWAYRSTSKILIPVIGLEKRLEFEQEFSSNPDEKQQLIKIPDSLPQGFYLVDSKWEDLSFQTFIQITEVGMYLMDSSTKTLIWLNDLSLKKPAYNAKISIAGSDKTYTTDKDGLAYFDSPSIQKTRASENITYYKIQTTDNKQAVLVQSENYRTYEDSNNSMYWNFIQLDRNLYKPDDTVNFWGLVKNRYSNEKATSLTIEVNQGNSYFQRYIDYKAQGKAGIGYFPLSEPPLVSKELTVKDGIFSGNFELPNLDPGGYQLVVKKNDQVVVNSYISIENFIKPAYKLEITKDKKAVFPEQAINFSIKGSFFEGTAVPDLQVDYNINSDSFGDNFVQKTTTTDSSGSIDVKYVPNPSANVQGEHSIDIYAHARLPEAGEITGNEQVRLFVNDINVNITSELKNNKGTVNAVVNKVVLERLNNGTAKDSMDYLGDAVSGKTLTGIIYKNTWVKIEDGEYYDYINKVTEKRYRYEDHKEVFTNISMTTDSTGKASATFDAPRIENGYYSAEIKCTDNSGRNMKFDSYVGDYTIFNGYDENRYFLDGGKENYKTGERVDLTYKKGNKTMPDGSYLFIKLQNGIRSYEVGSTPDFSFIMDEKDVPNVVVTGVYFNGITYVQSEEFNAVFNYDEKNLVIDAKLDKTSYKPGDEVTVSINAKDKNGNPKKAVVNSSIVDEALFKLHEQQIETLQTLYASLPSGVGYSYQSHVNSGMSGGSKGAWSRGSIYTTFSEAANTKGICTTDMTITYDAVKLEYISGSGAPTAAIREDFKDTAYFNTITLNDNGYGELKFKIPDNITSWRVSLTGVTPDLHAGSNKVSLNVTLPFFINYTLNNTYLDGDKPVLGVTAYGNDLKENEKVLFEVCDSQNQKVLASAEGKAFDRVNIPLWELSEGKYDILIKASAEKGLKDSLKHTVSVLKTYHQIDEALYYDLKPGTNFKGGSTGNTKLIFTDKGRGMYLGELNYLRYLSGNRIDQKLAAQISNDLINTYFEQDDPEASISPVNVSSYQREDGGISLLPYGNSDIDTSAKLSSLILYQVNAFRLKEYFYTKLYDDLPGLKGNALYGLAVSKEPVLLELNKASETENASIKDLLYIALAYCELGELPMADRIFVEKIATRMKEYKPYLRIETGKDKDDILECTSLAALLASKLDKPQKSGLYDYCTNNESKDIFIAIDKLLYIKEEIAKANGGTVSFSYTLNGKSYSKTLEAGESFALTLPSKDINNLEINNVTGDISAVSMFKKPLAGTEKTDNNLTVKKAYYPRKGNNQNNSFKQDEIVKVVITWDISNQAIDGSYRITDFLPSGLKPINNPSAMGVNPSSSEISYMESDGQKVTFYVGKDWEKKTPLTYYARVISPGTYKAESTIIQSVSSKESLNFSDVGTVIIQ